MSKPVMRYGVVDGRTGSWTATPAASSFPAAVERRAAAFTQADGSAQRAAAAISQVVHDALASGNAEARAMATSAKQCVHRWAELAPERRGRPLTLRERAERAAVTTHGIDAIVWLLRRQLEINSQ